MRTTLNGGESGAWTHFCASVPNSPHVPNRGCVPMPPNTFISGRGLYSPDDGMDPFPPAPPVPRVPFDAVLEPLKG